MPTSSGFSHADARKTLDEILKDFDIRLPSQERGPDVRFTGDVPSPETTHSQKLNLSLVGTIPALANAVAAAQIYVARGGERQSVTADLRRGHNYIDPDIGMTPTLNGQEISLDVMAGNPFIRNIFETKDGRYAVLSAVYVDLVYKWSAFLGCSVAEYDVRQKVKQWSASDLEAAASKAGLPMAICQSEASWRLHPQGKILAELPWVPVQKYDAPSKVNTNSSLWDGVAHKPRRPLSGIKVLCVTHAIAGPSAGRTLAEHGASVLQIMFTHGFEHNFVYTYANLGTASARLNLHKPADRQRLRDLVREAHVWIDSFRPLAIAKFGFSDKDIRGLNPSMIVSRTRCYGTTGPWAQKPGFDMQGSASSGMMDLCGRDSGDGRPQWPPGMVINDYTTGYAAALAIQSILLKRFTGGVDAKDGWLLSPSLTGTAMGILKYFKTERFSTTPKGTGESCQALPPRKMEQQTGLGYLKTLAPLPEMSLTPLEYEHGLLEPLGSAKPVFPGYDDGYDTQAVAPMTKEEVGKVLAVSVNQHMEHLRVLGEEARRKRDADDDFPPVGKTAKI